MFHMGIMLADIVFDGNLYTTLDFLIKFRRKYSIDVKPVNSK